MSCDTEIVIPGKGTEVAFRFLNLNITAGVHDYLFLEKVACKILNPPQSVLSWVSGTSMAVLSPSTNTVRVIEKSDKSGTSFGLPVYPLGNYPNITIRDYARLTETDKPAIVVGDETEAVVFLPSDTPSESGHWPLDEECADAILKELSKKDLHEVVKALFSVKENALGVGKLTQDDETTATTFRVIRRSDTGEERSISIVHVESKTVFSLTRIPKSVASIDPRY